MVCLVNRRVETAFRKSSACLDCGVDVCDIYAKIFPILHLKIVFSQCFVHLDRNNVAHWSVDNILLVATRGQET